MFDIVEFVFAFYVFVIFFRSITSFFIHTIHYKNQSKGKNTSVSTLASKGQLVHLDGREKNFFCPFNVYP